MFAPAWGLNVWAQVGQICECQSRCCGHLCCLPHDIASRPPNALFVCNHHVVAVVETDTGEIKSLFVRPPQ